MYEKNKILLICNRILKVCHFSHFIFLYEIIFKLMYQTLTFKLPWENVLLGWIKSKWNSSRKMKGYHLFSKVITKIKQALVPLFHQMVKTSFVERVLLILKPVSNSVHDFVVRMKTSTLQCLFSGLKL